MYSIAHILCACRRMGAVHRWCRADDRGNVGLVFAAVVIPVVGMIGFSIDYGQALSARASLQSAMDSAVLAAGREYQVSGDANRAIAEAETHFTVAMQGRDGVEILTNTVHANDSRMTFSARVRTPTTFARLLGIENIEVSSTSEAMLTAGGIDKNLEISLMLDITGSMCQPCSKLMELKTAAKDLIDIVVQDDQSKFTSRVALVPFSNAVNVGSTYFEPVTGEVQVVEDQYSYPAGCYKDGRLKSTCEGNPKYLAVEGHSYSSCVVERAGSNKFTDSAPAGDPQAYLGVYDVERANASVHAIDEDTPCEPQSRIVPLSSDKAGLQDAIDEFRAGGFTAGHIGTAWAWYMLSPSWNTIWPAESQTAAYGDAETMKIAVLMTDGDYNAAYQTGNGSSDAQAKQICRNMKSEGVTVYTVGFKVSAKAKALLENCATSAGQFFDATSGDELKLAFRQIAFNIAQLRLSK